MKSFKTYLEESHKFSCIMAEFDAFSTKRILNIVDMIPDEWVYEEEGKEYTPHITIRYGINLKNFDKFPKVMFSLAHSQHFEIEGMSKFDTHDDYDVLLLKPRETPKMFHVWRDFINSSLDVAEETYPEYKPHITLAYMKKGYAQKFIEEYEDQYMSVAAESVNVDKVVVSLPNKCKLTIPLTG